MPFETNNNKIDMRSVKGKKYMPKVADAIFKVDGQIAFIAKCNTESNVTIETTTDDVRGGQNNQIIGSLMSQRDVNASFSTPEWKIEFLAANVGSEIQIGTIQFNVTSITANVVDGKIMLPAVPSDKVIYIDINDTWVKVVATTTEIALADVGISEDTKCVTCMGLFDKNGKEVAITTDDQPLTGELTLTAPIFEGSKGKVGDGAYIFPAFQLSGSWNHGFSSDASYEISGKAIAVEGAGCGEGEVYGWYREYIEDDETLNQYGYIAVSPSEDTLSIKDSDTVTLNTYGYKSGLYAPAELTDVTYASDKSDIATVEAQTGVVTPVAKGTAVITATYGDMTATATIEVIE